MPPIDLRQVPYGPDAAAALRDAVARAKGDEPLDPVTVVVPSNHVGVTARRLLASGRLGAINSRGEGVAAVTFLTTYRLAELLGAARLAGSGRRPVSTPVIAAAVRRVLAAAPGLFATVAQHPATETALVAAYRELRDLPSPDLDALAASGPRASDVVRIHRATRTALAPDWSDEEDLMASARDRLATDRAAGTGLGTVIVYLPQRTSLHASALLVAVGEVTPIVVIAGVAGDESADAEVRTSLIRLGLDAGPTPAVGLPVDRDRTQLVSCSDADDEVRAAVRSVVEAARRGTPLDRIAILHPGPDPYARLLHEHLDGAAITINGASAVPLSARVAGRALAGPLHMADGTGGWTRQAVMAWLNGAPILHEGRRTPIVAWERVSRDAGVVGGRDQWDQRLADHARALDDEATSKSASGDDGRAESLRRRADQSRTLRAFVLGHIDEIDSARRRPRSWGDHSRWARRLLDRLVGSASRRATSWPDAAEQRAAERVELAIDRLGALDTVEDPVELDVVIRTLSVELDSDLGRVGRFGDGVLVGTTSLGIGLDLDLVVVVGLAEGLCPRPPRDDSLLPDRERRAADGRLALRGGSIGRQHRELLAAMASARSQVLSFPRGDLRRSNEQVPSRWLLDVASTLAGVRWWADEMRRGQAPWLTQVASFDHGLRTLLVPATAQEHRLRALLAAGAGPRTVEVIRSLGDEVLSAGADLVAGRSSPILTRFDGNLAGMAVASPAAADSAEAGGSGGKVASATGLERWARCPFDYFMRDVLGVREVENPEDNLTITPADRGSLVHEVLERFVLEVLARPAADRPGPKDRWTGPDRERLRELAEDVSARYQAEGKTGRRLFWGRDRAQIEADLDATLTFDEEMRERHGSRHYEAELRFGVQGARVETIALPLPDGRQVRFRGKADRIDRTDDGALVVVDYKTGGDRDYKSLSEDDPDQGGTRLQLYVYGAAARAAVGETAAPVRSEYWFVSTKGSFKPHGYDLTPEVTDRVTETLGLIVEGIEGGSFPSHPTDQDEPFYNPCWSCDPDDLGVGDLRRAWAAKADHPGLGPYLTLIDPDRRMAGDGGAVVTEGDRGGDGGDG